MRTALRLLLLFVALSSGCANYRATALPILQPEFAPYSADQNGVTVSCKAFSRYESKRYLGRDVQAKGYQPIQICVQNETKAYLLVSPQSLNVPLAPPEDVARYVHTNTVGRALVYGVPGLLIWPLLVPAVVDGVGSSQANEKLDADYSSKGVNETVIQPYTTLNRIFFVPRSEFNGAFKFTLFDKEIRKTLVYEVRFPAGV